MQAASAVLMLLGALRQALHADGHRDCPCIGLPSTVAFVDCDKKFSFNGKCVMPPAVEWRATNGGRDPVLYPGDYGSMCKKHFEPGDVQCWDLVTGHELPINQRASSCDASWCYVDPADCNNPLGLDSAQSAPWQYSDMGWKTNVCLSAGTCQLAYSYETCDVNDEYTKRAYIGKTRDFALLLMSEFMNV
jgi:hypothetical protein